MTFVFPQFLYAHLLISIKKIHQSDDGVLHINRSRSIRLVWYINLFFTSATTFNHWILIMLLKPLSLVVKALRKPPPRQKPQEALTRSEGGRGRNPMPSISTRCSDKCTQTPVCRAKLCPSWTASWTISSRESQPRLLDSLTTTRGLPLQAEKYRQLSVFFCQVNSPSTPSVRAPRPSQSTQAASKRCALCRYIQRPFLGPLNTLRN